MSCTAWKLHRFTGKVGSRGFRERIQCPKKGEQYAFVTVWIQGHSAKLDDTLWVQVWGRGGQGAMGEEGGIKTANGGKEVR